jgi:hypothetical protein
LGDVLAQHSDFLLHDLARLHGSPASLLGLSEFINLGRCERIEFPDAVVAFGERPFELVNRATMSSFAIAEFDLQLMHTVLSGLQLLHLGAEPVSIGETLVELRDLFAQDSHFSLHNIPGLLGGPTELLSGVKFIGSSRKNRFDFADPVVAAGKLFIELSDMVAELPNFLFQNLAGFLGGSTSLLGSAKIIGLSGGVRLDCMDTLTNSGPFRL